MVQNNADILYSYDVINESVLLFFLKMFEQY